MNRPKGASAPPTRRVHVPETAKSERTCSRRAGGMQVGLGTSPQALRGQVQRSTCMPPARMWVVGAFPLDQPRTNLRAHVIQYRNRDGDEPHGDTCGPVVQESDVLHQQESDTTTTNQTDDRGHADIDVPPVD